MQFIFNNSYAVADWVLQRIPDIDDFGKCEAIGIVKDDRLICGVVYNNFRDHDIQMSIAADDPRWCQRGVLYTLFAYPFLQLNLPRVSAFNCKNNHRARSMTERLGFKLEGVARKAWDGKHDACMYGMLREHCKWIVPKQQKVKEAA